jgi:hypothetical protein
MIDVNKILQFFLMWEVHCKSCFSGSFYRISGEEPLVVHHLDRPLFKEKLEIESFDSSGESLIRAAERLLLFVMKISRLLCSFS